MLSQEQLEGDFEFENENETTFEIKFAAWHHLEVILADEMITTESLKDMLEDLRCDVTASYICATKALEAIKKDDEPDFALFDTNLKGEESGVWTAEQMCQQHDIPCAFLTSCGDKATTEKATKTVLCGHLLKPVEKQNLFHLHPSRWQ